MKFAALKNMSEGSGTAIDAAKVIRAARSQDLNLPPNSALVRDATALAKLADDAFTMVVNEIIDPSYAAVVGRLVGDPQVHAQVIGEVAQARPSSKIEAESMVRDLLSAPTIQSVQESLFGSEESARILLKERAQVRGAALRALKRDRQVFKTLVDEEGRIAAAGNTLKGDENAKRAADDGAILDVIAKLSDRRGPVADALARASKDVAGGASVTSASREYLEALRAALGEAGGNIGRIGETRAEGPVADAEPLDLSDIGRPTEEDGQDGFGFSEGRRRSQDRAKAAEYYQRIAAQQRGADAGPDGKDQLFIPGAEHVPPKTLLQRMADAPLKPGASQKQADDGLFGDGHKQRDMFGEGASKEYAFTDLGPFKVERAEPIGRQAGDYVVREGKKAGVEFLLAFNEDGEAIANLRGGPTSVGLPADVERMLVDPKQSIVVHHNHPRNTSLSAPDISMLGALGLRATWAHGHKGAVSRAGLTAAGRAKLEEMPINDAIRRLYDAADKAGADIFTRLNAKTRVGEITVAEADAVHAHLANEVLSRAKIIVYHSNIDADELVAKLGLQPHLELLAERAERSFFDGRSNEYGDNRPAVGVGHVADLGTALGGGEDASRKQPYPVAPDRRRGKNDRAQAEREAAGQVRLPGFAQGGERFSPGKPFYSAVARAVEGAKMPKAAAAQWMGYLRNQPGVKPEELDWIGLEPWLQSQAGAITREAVADFARANQVQVKEVERSDEARGATMADWERAADAVNAARDDAERDRLRDIRDQIRDRLNETEGEGTKFSEYQLPGGENYRELLMTLPEKRAASTAAGNKIADFTRQLREKYGERYISQAPRADLEEYQRLLGEQDRLEAEERGSAYTSSHWDEPNVLLHVRFNERTDAAGKRTLFIEEIQSDWHQAGRKRGYKNGDAAALEAELQKAKDYYNGLDAGKLTHDGRKATPDDMLAAYAETDRLRKEIEAQKNGVPDAPFKTTWPEIGLKRMIRWAAENGFDQIAWTPGDVQADRYDLSKQVDTISYATSADGTYSISVRKGREELLKKRGMDAAALEARIATSR